MTTKVVNGKIQYFVKGQRVKPNECYKFRSGFVARKNIECILWFNLKTSTMKKLIFIIAMLFVISIISVSCEKDEDTTEKSSGY